MAGAFGADGTRSAEGHAIFQDYFTGDRAAFPDSSNREKNRFRRELTFSDPANPGAKRMFPWHGKVSRMTLRIHHSWPIRAGEPVVVVYVGPKLTRK